MKKIIIASNFAFLLVIAWHNFAEVVDAMERCIVVDQVMISRGFEVLNGKF